MNTELNIHQIRLEKTGKADSVPKIMKKKILTSIINNMKSESLVKKKALQPSEFKMKSDVEENISPSRRMIENKMNRLKNNQSKQLHRNDSQSQLSSNKKLNRNESQRTLSKENILGSSDKNEHSMSKKLIKNLREHIALKLYENNVPTSGYHRVVGKSRYF